MTDPQTVQAMMQMNQSMDVLRQRMGGLGISQSFYHYYHLTVTL